MSDGIDIDAVHRLRDSLATVSDYLERLTGTTNEIVAATGFSRSSVEASLRKLRVRGDACLANFRTERPGPASKGGVKKPPKPQPAIAVALALRAKQQESANRVPQALAARSPLEQAWCGIAA